MLHVQYVYLSWNLHVQYVQISNSFIQCFQNQLEFSFTTLEHVQNSPFSNLDLITHFACIVQVFSFYIFLYFQVIAKELKPDKLQINCSLTRSKWKINCSRTRSKWKGWNFAIGWVLAVFKNYSATPMQKQKFSQIHHKMQL